MCDLAREVFLGQPVGKSQRERFQHLIDFEDLGEQRKLFLKQRNILTSCGTNKLPFVRLTKRRSETLS